MAASFDDYLKPWSAAEVLLRIRKGQLTRVGDVPEPRHPEAGLRFGIDLGTTNQVTLHQLRAIVNGLKDAGLVAEEDGVLSVTPLLSKIQGALGLSLSELASADGTFRVRPLFGIPRAGVLKVDVFVLMPFAEDFDPIYQDHISKVVREAKFTVARPQEIFRASGIMDDIWAAISETRVIVAECSRRNPNVFYEIGIAHAIGKPVILITQDIEDVPFDLRHLRVIKYDTSPQGLAAFEHTLSETIKATFSGLDAGGSATRLPNVVYIKDDQIVVDAVFDAESPMVSGVKFCKHERQSENSDSNADDETWKDGRLRRQDDAADADEHTSGS